MLLYRSIYVIAKRDSSQVNSTSVFESDALCNASWMMSNIAHNSFATVYRMLIEFGLIGGGAWRWVFWHCNGCPCCGAKG